jgi:DNA polymerase-3 subunit epsilon
VGKIAVIDVETTGLNPHWHNRIIEIAAVVMKPDGTVQQEFNSLINPERDIGPTSIHGLSSIEIIQAPLFADIAGLLCKELADCVAIAGHNVRFDLDFLRTEFERMGQMFPECSTFCTMRLSGGGSLSTCCSHHQIKFDGTAHCALNDARATAQLFSTLITNHSEHLATIDQLAPIAWPSIPLKPAKLMTREDCAIRKTTSPAYLQDLLSRMAPALPSQTKKETALDYANVLDRVLEDRRVDKEESDALLDMATRWGLNGTDIIEIHHEYVHRLAAAALADNVITPSERKDLEQVAHLLGIDQSSMATIMEFERRKRQQLDVYGEPNRSLPEGNHKSMLEKRVCFTGELQCQYNGQPITRTMATELAEERGMTVVSGVAKCDILVVADPHTQSSKAKTARQRGIRIMHEPVFWREIGVKVE